MTKTQYLISVIVLFIVSIIYLIFENSIKSGLKKFYTIEQFKVTNENAKIALEQISSWTTWLTGLQTAAIASMGIMCKDHCLYTIQKTLGFFAVIFFAHSIIFSTFLLCSIPSIQQRLKKKSSFKNDIYNIDLFSGISISLQQLSGLIHTYFIIGVILFTFYIFTFF
jgi:hypothetical protein